MHQPKTWLQDALIPPEPDGHFAMIPLTQGKFALVDEADAEVVISQGRWIASLPGGRTWYAVHSRGSQGMISMHTLVTGHKGVDHVNHNGLDNRRINLRPATQQQNAANRPLMRNNTSGYKGVFWQKGKWAAHIGIDYRKKYLGRFTDPVEAARAYNAAALELYGEFAWLNPV